MLVVFGKLMVDEMIETGDGGEGEPRRPVTGDVGNIGGGTWVTRRVNWWYVITAIMPTW